MGIWNWNSANSNWAFIPIKLIQVVLKYISVPDLECEQNFNHKYTQKLGALLSFNAVAYRSYAHNIYYIIYTTKMPPSKLSETPSNKTFFSLHFNIFYQTAPLNTYIILIVEGNRK